MNNPTRAEVDGAVFTLRTIAEDFAEQGWSARAEQVRKAIALLELFRSLHETTV